uniref:Small ribosomal subunit protein uS9c n=1 Tax=Halimeda minima TaxID=170427 RepID=A0A386AZ09_9CHLO|nr:ribosomal protein S9 [Halimeda minima]
MKYTYYGIGRRKSAIAQVFIVKSNSSESFSVSQILVNQSSLTNYFQTEALAFQYIQKLVPEGNKFFKIKVKVSGGGKTSQKEAIHLALARAFCKIDSTFKKPNLLTQDSRIKERKKYGLKKARKAPQYSKR